MGYAATAHNRSVYAAPAVAGLGFRSLGQSLCSFPRSLQTHFGGAKCYAFFGASGIMVEKPIFK